MLCRKYENILQLNTTLTNLFFLILAAQFTAKTTNSERTNYFLSPESCSINKLQSHMLFTYKNFMFPNFTWKKKCCSWKWGGGLGGNGASLPPLWLRPCNILSYSVAFTKKKNLLYLRHWFFPGKFIYFSEAATGGVLWEKLFLKKFRIFTGKLRACNFIKKRIQHRCFPLIIAKFLRTPILKNIC